MNTAADDMLRDCCWAVGESLRREHLWTTSDTGDPNVETEKDGNFVNTLMVEIVWMFDERMLMLMMEAKAAALRAEADVLEMQVQKWMESE